MVSVDRVEAGVNWAVPADQDFELGQLAFCADPAVDGLVQSCVCLSRALRLIICTTSALIYALNLILQLKQCFNFHHCKWDISR